MGIVNIEKVYNLVDERDFDDGVKAYQRYHRTMQRMADIYGLSLARVTAAFAALSPNNDYIGNLRSLKTLIVGYQRGLDLRDLTVSTFNACKERAWAYLTGAKDFLDVTKGPKTRSFYLNIMRPKDDEPITIDGHMVNIYNGERRPLIGAGNFPYRQIADTYRGVAVKHDLIPNQLQAMLWFTWKRIHNIRYQTQMSLFHQDDIWGLELSKDEIISMPVYRPRR